MRDLPRPGVEPVSPALAGGFFTTEPPGKPPFLVGFFFFLFICSNPFIEFIILFTLLFGYFFLQTCARVFVVANSVFSHMGVFQFKAVKFSNPF